MSELISMTIARDVRRGSMREVTDAADVVGLNRNINAVNSGSFAKGEVIDLSKTKAKLAVSAIRGGQEMLIFVVETNKGIRNFFPSSCYKSRTPWDEELKTPAAERRDNHKCGVAKFYEKCPSLLVFMAAIAGQKLNVTSADRIKVAGWDAEENTVSIHEKDTQNTTFNDFEFAAGKEPAIKEEWLGPDGEEKAAEYLFKYYGAENTNKEK